MGSCMVLCIYVGCRCSSSDRQRGWLQPLRISILSNHSSKDWWRFTRLQEE